MIKTVLFDFDGTIFDTCEGVMKSVQYALHKMGIEEPFENLYDFMGPPLVVMFMEKYGFTSQQADEAVEYFRERYTPVGWKECRPYDGIADVIRTLRNSVERRSYHQAGSDSACAGLVCFRCVGDDYGRGPQI